MVQYLTSLQVKNAIKCYVHSQYTSNIAQELQKSQQTLHWIYVHLLKTIEKSSKNYDLIYKVKNDHKRIAK